MRRGTESVSRLAVWLFAAAIFAAESISCRRRNRFTIESSQPRYGGQRTRNPLQNSNWFQLEVPLIKTENPVNSGVLILKVILTRQDVVSRSQP
jgi:hypothetical protein